MLTTIKNRALEAAKALVAVATPIVTSAIIDIIADIQRGVLVAIAGGATGLTVYFTRNKTKAV